MGVVSREWNQKRYMKETQQIFLMLRMQIGRISDQ